MTDPYRVLNVPRSADQAAIKQAYRKLAKTLHPDRNPGNAGAEQRFKEVTQAYQLLSDPAKRARFDRGEIDAAGRPRHDFGFGGGFGSGFGGRRGGAAQGGPENLFEKMFGSAFGRGFAGHTAGGQTGASFEELLRGQTRGAGGAPRQKQRGADRRYRLEIDFVDAARGGRQRLQLDDGRTIEVEVPPGTENSRTLRLKGQGAAGTADGPAGDALVQIEVRRHPQFSREGQDVHVEVAIALAEAVLGTRVTVPTLDGPVRLAVPPGTSSGRSLRLKGKGIAGPGGGRGDQYVRLLVTLPDVPDAELEAWARRQPRPLRD
ncbi:MAG TPA: J domain-containing protein [Geminicoccaceae bacterium]|nr:J domain-containing protein [Geminicoccaceae bacterium]